REFVRQEIGDRHAYQWALHVPTAADGGEQPHFHLMFSERQVDGIDRDPEQYFKRYNAKAPEKGGARKGYGPSAGQTLTKAERAAELKELRGRWEAMCNAHLERAGVEQRIDMRSHAERGTGLEPERKQLPSAWRGEGRAQVIEFRAARAEVAQAAAELRRRNHPPGSRAAAPRTGPAGGPRAGRAGEGAAGAPAPGAHEQPRAGPGDCPPAPAASDRPGRARPRCTTGRGRAAGATEPAHRGGQRRSPRPRPGAGMAGGAQSAGVVPRQGHWSCAQAARAGTAARGTPRRVAATWAAHRGGQLARAARAPAGAPAHHRRAGADAGEAGRAGSLAEGEGPPGARGRGEAATAAAHRARARGRVDGRAGAPSSGTAGRARG
ncbi:TPA: MobA/MobL family protein, partial [Escherichia coli]|nr:MobA/MobL family protein [Escherichia coli]EJC5013961.1 MobA/MobL family protein [Escherichia coli]HBI9779637.1 MobA/MobL family protein [Escherichia coli]HBI9861827.1 MobA/MobL family protein [Escherichia coli]HBI9866768.1 MobA/MobL family protein [Escherichia coli]